MNVVFLGTASCFPTPTRGVSCIALQFERSGDIWIFDCGEGSQIQIQKSRLKPGKVTKIFITHLHGDHLYGLPGFLCTLGNGDNNEKKKIDLYGPLGLKKYVNLSLSISCSPLPYEVEFHEMIPLEKQFVEGVEKCPFHFTIEQDSNLIGYDEKSQSWNLFRGANVSVIAGPILHRIPSFGFVIQESDQPGSLNAEKLLNEFGIKPGPIYGQLKMGKSVSLENGQVLDPRDFLGDTKKGKKVAILGDTHDTRFMDHLLSDCDLLVHEATMENGLREKAVQFGHSTPEMAAKTAMKCGVKKLVLTHLSPRYKPLSLMKAIVSAAGEGNGNGDEKSSQILLDEAREFLREQSCEFCTVEIAEDFFELKV